MISHWQRNFFEVLPPAELPVASVDEVVEVEPDKPPLVASISDGRVGALANPAFKLSNFAETSTLVLETEGSETVGTIVDMTLAFPSATSLSEKERDSIFTNVSVPSLNQ